MEWSHKGRNWEFAKTDATFSAHGLRRVGLQAALFRAACSGVCLLGMCSSHP